MKKSLSLLLLFCCTCFIQAQTDNVYISVAMRSDCSLDSNTQTILKNKLQQILSTKGVASTECGATIMVPEVSILNSNTVSGGMRNITSVELGISIVVKNMITEAVFNSIQISTKGEGYSEIEAQRAAINKINVRNTDYLIFVDDTKARISDYYETKTGAIIAKANTLAAQQKYDEALALLSTYPEMLSGYAEVSKAISSIFEKCQTQYCSQILLSAQAAYSRREYKEAADLATMIDAQSSCASEAKSLINSIKNRIDDEHNEKIRREKEQMELKKEQMDLEKEQMLSNERKTTATITAVKDIVTSYFTRQTRYNFI